MNKKRLVVSIIVLIILIGVGAFFYSLNEKKTKEAIVKDSIDLVTKWGNFKDESSDSYLNSIKPYLTDESYTDYADSAQELKDMNTDNKYEPTQSIFTIEGEPQVKKVKTGYEVTITGKRNYVSVKSFNQTVSIFWQKVGGNYIVTNLYTDN